MMQLAQHYQSHINTLNQRVAEICAREGLSGLAIHSGQPHRQFLDDIDYPFKVNPHFKAWVPLLETPHCWLLVNGRDKPVLIFYRPEDFWHKVTDLPQSFWCDSFDIRILTKADKVAELLPVAEGHWAYIGEHLEVASVLGFNNCNPEAVMSYLHFYRACKTDYELECMRQANRIAVKGHRAAKNAFYSGASEFEIQQQYLSAIAQGENQIPYGNIIALNQNAAILHYTALEHESPQQRLSFLIDAGASFHGYAADISRTYAFEKNRFHDLIQAMNQLQLQLIEHLRPGKRYTELHLLAHQQLATLLLEVGLARGSSEMLLEQGITRAFFPHGLGHMLGLQVHDVGGFFNDERGTHVAPPEEHPFLRCTRTMAPGHVVTIEPGLYFIDSLLAPLRQDGRKALVDWDLVASLRPFGGIRIEDNVIIHAHSNENMTRESGLID
ncbi:Xaa-Pro dipeptidase [Shewanella indica]|uniref:Xaa-Pro dipeptidase n=1 Tax=Shewanella indica TaxID=768528 RepID=UPI00313ED318